MKITIESSKLVATVVVDGHEVPARIWTGETEAGIPVMCYITRIAPMIYKEAPDFEDKLDEFERDLKRQPARVDMGAIPLRLIL
jgi:hypothetical protein